ncbi:MAG: isoprenylcysteine carboxylmethyltransferase family protein [Propionibacteriaceae bacterium]|nr:isoprenylcysteine carboxylmethyltransferase family protein [Propionibacteriaceae bacterium]
MPTTWLVIGYVCAYLLIAGFFLIERFVRRGEDTKNMGRTGFDKGSTTVISVVMGVAFILVPLGPLWNALRIGPRVNLWVAVVGTLVGVAGLVIRYKAFSTLGRFFTRTLREQPGHTLVTSGIYRLVRHPGYLSDLAIFIGAALAMRNLVVVIIVLVSFIPAYVYRIHAEEQMLLDIFGCDYQDYQARSKRLLPYLW